VRLPRATDRLAGSMWLPRILAKARLLARGELPEDDVSRFCHPTGVDGHFLSFFGPARGELVAAAAPGGDQASRWFLSLAAAEAGGVERWNHVAVNLGRPGFPMAERLPIALSTTYRHLSHLRLDTVFEALEADEAPG
jgi:hypothetical protein